MAIKLVDKVLGFIGFEEESVETDDKHGENRSDKEEKTWHKRKDREKDKDKGTVLSLHAQRQVQVVVVDPVKFDEVQGIADNLKNRRPVIVNLEHTDNDLAKRVVDFASGVTYALNGSMQKVGNGIFLFVPNNIDIASELKDQGSDKDIFSWMRS